MECPADHVVAHRVGSDHTAVLSTTRFMSCRFRRSFFIWSWHWPLVGDAPSIHYGVFLIRKGWAP